MFEWQQGMGQVVVAVAAVHAVVLAILYFLRDKLFAPFAESYARKHGDILAAKHQLPELINQLKATTNASQEIVTAFQKELSVHNQGWQLKLEIYTTTIKRLQGAAYTFALVGRALRDSQDSPPKAPPFNTIERMESAVVEIAEARALMTLFGSPKEIELVGTAIDPGSFNPKDHKGFEAQAHRLSGIALAIALSARSSLGIAQDQFEMARPMARNPTE